jgi:hypothetical protein
MNKQNNEETNQAEASVNTLHEETSYAPTADVAALIEMKYN